MIETDGCQMWYLHGQLHRVDGPAAIWSDGRHHWYLHGQCHRVDGPAMIHADGSQRWFVQGQEFTREVVEWLQDNTINLPFTTEQRVEFCLRWL